MNFQLFIIILIIKNTSKKIFNIGEIYKRIKHLFLARYCINTSKIIYHISPFTIIFIRQIKISINNRKICNINEVSTRHYFSYVISHFRHTIKQCVIFFHCTPKIKFDKFIKPWFQHLWNCFFTRIIIRIIFT